MRRASFTGTKFGGGGKIGIGKRGRAKACPERSRRIPSPRPPSFLPARAFSFLLRLWRSNQSEFRLNDLKSLPAFPPAETRRAKQNNFLFNSLIFRATLFLLKGIENCFALMFGLMPNGGNASHPTAPTAQNRREKIPSPHPTSL